MEGGKLPMQGAIKNLIAREGTLGGFKMGALSTFGKEMHLEILNQQKKIDKMNKG